MPVIGGFDFDENAFKSAMNFVQEKLGDRIQEVANTTHELAKEDSPVGWHVHRPLSNSPAPRGYRGGTNRKSITTEFINTHGGTKSLGDMGPSGDKEGMPGRGDLGFRIYTQSGYGAWLELGTQLMAARPYIYPAFMRAVDGMRRDMEGCI